MRYGTFVQEAALDFCNQLYVFFWPYIQFIQLHSTDFIMTQNKSKQTAWTTLIPLPETKFSIIVVTLDFKWYPCCAECFPELFWTKWYDTHGELLQNDGNKTTIIIAYHDKIQENTIIDAVL